MENKVLQKNIEAISRYDRALVDKILMFNIEKSNLSLSQTQQGEYNIIFKNEPIHSEQSAIQQAKNIVSNLKDKNNSIKIVYGLGLGYLVDLMAQELPKSTIIVYEPELEILFFVLQVAQIDALYKNNVILCSDKETLKKHIQDHANDTVDISIAFLNSYKKMYEKDISDVFVLAEKIKEQFKAGINTLIVKTPKAISNIFDNLKEISKSTPISNFVDIYKGKTALVISAGPSLRENIEIIKKSQDKFVIFAIGAVLKLLLKEGITPDFVVDIETENSDFQYENEDLSKTYLIFESFVNPMKYKLKSKGTISYISQNNFINQWLREKLNISLDIETCGTVSYTALYSAFLMGFDEIIVIGQDLAYKKGQCYSQGSWFEDLECVFDEKLNEYVIQAKDIEKYIQKSSGNNSQYSKEEAQKYINNLNKNLTTIKGQDGSPLLTQAGYVFFAEHFAETATKLKEQKPNLRLINSSIGGAQIDGFENIALDCVVEKLEKIEKQDLKLEQNDFYDRFLDDIKLIKEELEQYKLMAKEAIILVNKIISELKIKKVVTQNNLKTINKHNELLGKIISQSNLRPWKTLSAQFSLQLLPLIENPEIEDLAKHIKMYENIKNIYAKIVIFSDRILLKLTNC